MRMVIVDTNVVVAGLLTQEFSSPTARILDGMLQGAFVYVLSQALLTEYREVCLRPKIKALHRLSEEMIDEVLTEITANAVWRDPSGQSKAPDPDDDHLWSLLDLEKTSVLVTGDKLLLGNSPPDRQVLSPAKFVVDW